MILQEIAGSLTLTLLFLMDQDSTRRYLRPLGLAVVPSVSPHAWLRRKRSTIHSSPFLRYCKVVDRVYGHRNGERCAPLCEWQVLQNPASPPHHFFQMNSPEKEAKRAAAHKVGAAKSARLCPGSYLTCLIVV